ncbi:MAG: methylated-DNA--[protein]-cysteine S-methyltransferase [Firmicutes bacterium]|jgi:methylated-DNA-[protein]-cysteine S-methyltransferase|nr:methylated-DNA--[protein]-cysteine S-methyltransferase [Candidatus Fermentithermobacillaceae bacterium]
MISQIVLSPIGPLKITVDDGFVTGLGFYRGYTDAERPGQAPVSRIFPLSSHIHGELHPKDLNILDKTIKELDSYFSGRLRRFSVPVKVSGTQFQQAVWRAMGEIPYGQTKTYKELAKAAGSPKAARAVGNACAANPVAIIIPCHRVVAQHGLGGFGGGTSAKQWLLALERQNSQTSVTDKV